LKLSLRLTSGLLGQHSTQKQIFSSQN